MVEQYDWMGITLSPTANFVAEKLNQEKMLPDYYTFTKIPFNDRTTKPLWTINWPSQMNGVMEYMKDKRNSKDAILESFSKSPSSTESFLKYQNTLDFFNKMNKTK